MTKATFNTVIGILAMLYFGECAKAAFEAKELVDFAAYVVITGVWIWVFNIGYKNLPEK